MKSYKSILICLTIAFTTGLTFAQSNESHIEQVGTSHKGYIQQEPGNITYGSYIGNFPGNGFDGLPNGIPFQGKNGADGSLSDSYAEILQYESSNMASILQAGSHWAQIFQLGFSNIASILQENGSGESSSFNPPGVANPCPPPFEPCDASSNDGSTAYIYQDGDENEAKIVQYGSQLEAIIHQYGDENYASILQDFRGVSSSNSMSGYRMCRNFSRQTIIILLQLNSLCLPKTLSR
ncbi:MAG: curlin repeat-containing protein [Balneolaceae bacterium]|nr:curlin repeat-containing protein [Balneolaceae bacterium]